MGFRYVRDTLDVQALTTLESMFEDLNELLHISGHELSVSDTITPDPSGPLKKTCFPVWLASVMLFKAE